MKNSNFATYSFSKRMRGKIPEKFSLNFITVKDNNLKTIAIQKLNEPKLRLEFINDVVFRKSLSDLQKAGDEKLKAKAKQLLKHIETELNQ
jgi:hypothetical protein